MLCEIRLIPDGEIGITPDFGSGISRSNRGWGIFNTHACILKKLRGQSAKLLFIGANPIAGLCVHSKSIYNESLKAEESGKKDSNP